MTPRRSTFSVGSRPILGTEMQVHPRRLAKITKKTTKKLADRCCKAALLKKTCYFLLFITSFSWSVRSVAVIVQDYLDYPTLSKIETRIIEPPSLTICSSKSFSAIKQKPTVIMTDERLNGVIETVCREEPNTARLTGNQNSCYTCFDDEGFQYWYAFLAKQRTQMGKGTNEFGIYLRDLVAGNDADFIYIHPKNQHFSSPFYSSTNLAQGNRLEITMETSEDLPAPYSDCRNVGREENEQLSFYPDTFEYTRPQCIMSCYQAHYISRYYDIKKDPWFGGYMHENRSCLIGVPCNPYNRTSAFGYPLQPVSRVDNHREPKNYIRRQNPLFDELERCHDKCPVSCRKAAFRFKQRHKTGDAYSRLYVTFSHEVRCHICMDIIM